MRELIKRAGVCTLAVLIAAPAYAADISPYVSAKVGFGTSNFDDESTDVYTGSGFMLAGGAKYDAGFIGLRGELEISQLNYKGDSSTSEGDKLTSTSYMVNLYADFFSDYKIKPYIGVGFGRGELKFDIADSYAIEESKSMYGVNFGLGFNITKELGADVGVRYTMVPSLVGDTNFIMLSGNVGLRYTF